MVKFKRGNPEALYVRNGGVNLVSVQNLPLFQNFLILDSIVYSSVISWNLGTFFFFWYEVISCAKEFDLFISIQGNSWNVLCLPHCSICVSHVVSSFKSWFPQGLSC